MKEKKPTQSNRRILGVSRVVQRLLLACLIVSTTTLRAGVPTNAVVELQFSEGSGTTTVNTGSLGGSASFDFGTIDLGYPAFTNNVPTGVYAPTNNSFAIDFGPNISTNGGQGIDLTTDNGPLGTPGEFPQGLTICGWVNAREPGIGSGGNRIAFALETPNGLGFDLVQRAAGSLSLIVNQYNDGSPNSSTGKITADTNTLVSNWVFFAVTYDSNLDTNQVKFYFGKPDRLASLDVARAYAGGITNRIEFTGKLTIGNFSDVEVAREANGAGSRAYRGLIDELRIYTNVFTIDEVQQAQLNSAVPVVAAAILRQPTNLLVTAGQNARFDVEVTGSGAITYQWRTNGTPISGATNSFVIFPAVTTNDNGRLISVLVDNEALTDPGVLSSNALLGVAPAPVLLDTYLVPDADVAMFNTTTYDESPQGGQVAFGLFASGGVASGTRRSYLQFTLGSNLLAAAKLKLYNYWGGPEFGNGGRAVSTQIRIFGTANATPVTFMEPASNVATDFIPPDQTNFVTLVTTASGAVSLPGWYEFDITGWYNARLGQTTTLLVRGTTTSGFDFALFEDREGTAFKNGSANTISNSGPRIEFLLLPPRVSNITVSNNDVVLSGISGFGTSNFYVLASTNITLPATNWTKIATNQFDASGNFSTTNLVSPGVPARYYRLQVP